MRTSDRTTHDTMQTATAAGLGLAALGIVAQIAGGVPYPAIPPGLLILVAAAVFTLLARWWWAPVVGLAVSVFMVIGFVLSASLSRLGEPGNALAFLGTWVQLLAVLAVAALTGRALLCRRRQNETTTGERILPAEHVHRRSVDG